MRNWSRWCARQNPAVVLLPWLVAAATTVWMKVRALDCDAFRESAHGVRHSGVLTAWEKASLFRWDVLLGLVVIPAVLVVAGSLLPRRWRAAASGVLSAGIVAGLMVEEIVRCETGWFQSAGVLAEALRWSWRSHDASLLYVSAQDRIQMTALIAIVALLAIAAAVAGEQWRRRLNGLALTAVVAGSLAAAVLFVPKAPGMAWNTPMLLAVARAAEGPATAANDELPRTLPELHHRYCELAHAPAGEASGWQGRARGYNVIFFVLETAPAEVFDPAHDGLADMPNARRLGQHAFLGAEHFTTLALTSSALFSIFTSMYPHGPGPVGYTMAPNVELPGAIRALNAAGYQTGYYGYVWKSGHERDDRLLASLGFGKVAEPRIDPEADHDGATTFHGPLEYVEKHDREVLNELLRDIRRWSAARQRFAAAFFPELGHDPWRSLDAAKPGSMMERGHALAVHQDAWLGRVIDELEQDGALENTILVVTADHGLRVTGNHERASPEPMTGHNADDMVRVPLLIYVPRVLRSPVRIDWPTSHIDLAPTLLDLLDVRQGRKWEQGTDVWNPKLRQRRVFLVLDLFGAREGYGEAGSYYLRTGSGTVLKSSQMRFGESDALQQDAEESQHVREVLSEQSAVQQAMLFHLLRGD